MARDPKTGRFPPGNGAGKGDGWGGPAKGAGGPPIKPGDPEGIQRMSNDPDIKARNARRLARVKSRIFRLAMRAEREETQLSACIAFRNGEEGMPMQRNLNLSQDDVERMTDAELRAERARVDAALSEARQGRAQQGDAAGSEDLVH